MRVTREKHLSYMTKLTPLLILAYACQGWLFHKYAPQNLATEVTLSLGIALALLIVGFAFHDQHHQIILRENYVEVRFDLIKYQEEFLYRDIESIEVSKIRHSFADVTLTLRDGRSFRFFHIDQPQEFAWMLEEKKYGRKLSA